MKLYKDYIFDLYGTLVDIRTDEEQRALWNKMSLFYGYYGADYTPQTLHESYLSLAAAKEKNESAIHYTHEAYPEIPIEEVFRELYTSRGITPSNELVIHTGQMFRVFSTHHLRLYTGARELLQELRENGRGIYLLSNAQRIFTEYELRYLQIDKCFDGILISSDHGIKKPDIRFFRLLLEQYRIKPEDALMIGNDLNSDISGAQQIGMDTFYIHSSISPKFDKQVDADYAMMRMNLENLRKRLFKEVPDKMENLNR